MKDREFISLLNLYVDREISADDARRLEAEVASNPERRKVYDQYCRMQRACRILAEEHAANAPEADAAVVAFPAQPSFSMRPVYLGLAAAAACAFAVYGFVGGGSRPDAAQVASVTPAKAAQPAADEMKPVFATRPAPAAQSDDARTALFASSEGAARPETLNWIGDIRLTPVATPTDSQFLQGQKGELKGTDIADPALDRYDPQSAEMAAFRFQR
jgi:hypothetical protein